MSTSLTAVLILCKIPYVVPCKTRMRPRLNDKQCGELQDALLQDTLDMVRTLPYSVFIAYAPYAGKEYLAGTPGIEETFEQTQGDLGARLLHAIQYVFSKGFTRLIVIGGDCPELQPSILIAAAQALEETNVCLGPALDGGYYCIGLKQLEEELFIGIDWGTERVFQQTYAAAVEMGREVSLLPQLRDMDRWEDLVSFHLNSDRIHWEKRPVRTEHFIRNVMEERNE